MLKIIEKMYKINVKIAVFHGFSHKKLLMSYKDVHFTVRTKHWYGIWCQYSTTYRLFTVLETLVVSFTTWINCTTGTKLISVIAFCFKKCMIFLRFNTSNLLQRRGVPMSLVADTGTWSTPIKFQLSELKLQSFEFWHLELTPQHVFFIFIYLSMTSNTTPWVPP